MRKKLASHLGEYRRAAILTPMFSALEAVMDILLPTIMAFIIDLGIEKGDMNAIVKYGLLTFAVAAIALLRKPKVLILDDSTSAVDTTTDAKIRKAFREEIPGTTKIIIAQRISSVQDADRILVLDNGQINGLGTHEELLKNNAIYQEVYNSQTQGGGDFDKQGGEQ